MAAPPLSLKWIRTSSTTTTSLSSWESVQTVGGYVVSSIVASAPPFQAVGSGQIVSACFSPTVSHLTHVDALNQTMLPRPGGGKTELSGYLHQNTQTPNRFCCLRIPSSADNSVISPLLNCPTTSGSYPQPEFCLISPASPCVTP